MPQTPMPQVHPIPPLFDAESRVLILGSFPSIKSREAMFFYGHPQNRFWPLLALLTGEPTPQTVEEKRALALRHHFALCPPSAPQAVRPGYFRVAGWRRPERRPWGNPSSVITILPTSRFSSTAALASIPPLKLIISSFSLA